MEYKKIGIILAFSLVTGCTQLENLNEGLATLNNKLSELNKKTSTNNSGITPSKKDVTEEYNKFVKGHGYFKNVQRTVEYFPSQNFSIYEVRGDFYNNHSSTKKLVVYTIYQNSAGYKSERIEATIYAEGKNGLNNGWTPIHFKYNSDLPSGDLVSLRIQVE